MKEIYCTYIHISTVKRRPYVNGLHGKRPAKTALLPTKSMEVELYLRKGINHVVA